MLGLGLRAAEANLTHLGEHQQAGQQQSDHGHDLIQPAKVAQRPAKNGVGHVGQPRIVHNAQQSRAADDHKAGDEYVPSDGLVFLFHVSLRMRRRGPHTLLSFQSACI